MENALLERERMDRMLEAGTVEEAAKVLTECGYPELQAVNVDTVDAMLAQAREELFGTLNDLAPDGEILDVFKVKYDYHNAKAMLKCEALGLDPERLLVDTAEWRRKPWRKRSSSSEFTDLPKVMADAIVEARAVLGKTRDPQRSDMILDQAYFQEMEQLAKDSGSQFLLGYVQMLGGRRQPAQRRSCAADGTGCRLPGHRPFPRRRHSGCHCGQGGGRRAVGEHLFLLPVRGSGRSRRSGHPGRQSDCF